MEYKIFDLSRKEFQNIELPNCKITGNSSEYEIKDGKIYKYSIINGETDLNSKKEVSSIELTNYQISLFSQLKVRDGNSSIFDHNDLKKLSKDELTDEMNEAYSLNNVYEVVKAQVSKFAVSLQVKSKTDSEDAPLKNISIEFEKPPSVFKRFGNWIKNVFASKPENNEVIEAACIVEEVKPPKTLDLSEIFSSRDFDIIPARKHTVTGNNNDNKPYKYSPAIGISLDRLKAANPNKNMDWEQKVGSEFTIPEDYRIKPGSVKSISDIARIVGVSEEYINDILLGLEGKDKEFPFLTPYYDNVQGSGKAKKGILTLGYGHVGRIPGKYIKGCENPDLLYEMNSKNMANIEITKEQAYEILAQDILNAKIDALLYFGEDLLKAPQSIQDAVVDIVFNKGVDTGLRASGSDANSSPTNNLKENILNGDYVEAAKNTLYATNLNGLKKRNVYRFINSVADLSPSERAKAMEDYKAYYEEVRASFVGKGIEAELLDTAWNNALNGKCYGFFE